MQNKFPLPTSQNVSETVLDHRTRKYLQRLVDHKVVVSSRFLFINNTIENENEIASFLWEK